METGGYVTTHVLDTALGRPAAGLKIDVYRLDGDEKKHLGSFATNADGRTGAPVIASAEMDEAVYEVVFHAGEYLDREHGTADELRFLSVIPIRFGVGDARQHYHVPLLLSPFGYSTYRGS